MRLFAYDYAPGYNEISIWMPLQPVDTSSGCLEFIPGSHRERVLRHASPSNDPRIHALMCVDNFDETKAVPCPLPAGGCTIHHAARCTMQGQTCRRIRAAPTSWPLRCR